MLAIAGQDIDQFMREMEVVHKKRETERAQDLNTRLSLLESQSDVQLNNKIMQSDAKNVEFSEPMDMPTTANQQHPPVHLQQQHSIPSMGIPPPPLLYRPPPPPMHLRMPPPPPPRIGLRLPPGMPVLACFDGLFF